MKGGDDGEEKWDCQSILSTYSNIYNRPKLISERNSVSYCTSLWFYFYPRGKSLNFMAMFYFRTLEKSAYQGKLVCPWVCLIRVMRSLPLKPWLSLMQNKEACPRLPAGLKQSFPHCRPCLSGPRTRHLKKEEKERGW